MTTKLILVEGIPGSGKSTIARKIAEYYKTHDVAINLYIEGQSHPADLGWSACVPRGKYEELLNKYSNLRSSIERNTNFEGKYAIVAYTQVKTEDRAFYKELQTYEVYDGRVPDDVFFNLHYGRWCKFAEKAKEKEELNIFECAFLQNHVNELLYWRMSDTGTIRQHCNKLIDTVKDLLPVLIYLSQPDICETIKRVARERVSPEGPDGENWIDRVVEYCENSSFGKQHGITGFDGAMRFFTIRKQLEMEILSELSIPYIAIENIDYNWEDVWTKIEAYLRVSVH